MSDEFAHRVADAARNHRLNFPSRTSAEWTCECGEVRHDDFFEHAIAAALDQVTDDARQWAIRNAAFPPTGELQSAVAWRSMCDLLGVAARGAGGAR